MSIATAQLTGWLLLAAGWALMLPGLATSSAPLLLSSIAINAVALALLVYSIVGQLRELRR